jgi:hypothetical protein
MLINQKRQDLRMKPKVLGINLGKTIFDLIGTEEQGNTLLAPSLNRE